MIEFPPWGLAWHPHIGASDQKPTASLFTTPACAGMGERPSGGVWTSPWIEPIQMSYWSVHHDREGSRMHDVRTGWVMECPARPRTAILDTAQDILGLVERFPCRRHRHDLPKTFAYRSLLVDPAKHGRDYRWPPLDYVRLRAEYDALYVTVNCLDTSMWKSPGVLGFEVPTVLWLRPVWRLLGQISTVHLADMEEATAARFGVAHPE